MLLRSQPYNLVIRYRPGKEMTVADTLSRLSPEDRAPVVFYRPDYGAAQTLLEQSR